MHPSRIRGFGPAYAGVQFEVGDHFNIGARVYEGGGTSFSLGFADELSENFDMGNLGKFGEWTAGLTYSNIGPNGPTYGLNMGLRGVSRGPRGEESWRSLIGGISYNEQTGYGGSISYARPGDTYGVNFSPGGAGAYYQAGLTSNQVLDGLSGAWDGVSEFLGFGEGGFWDRVGFTGEDGFLEKAWNVFTDGQYATDADVATRKAVLKFIARERDRANILGAGPLVDDPDAAGVPREYDYPTFANDTWEVGPTGNTNYSRSEVNRINRNKTLKYQGKKYERVMMDGQATFLRKSGEGDLLEGVRFNNDGTVTTFFAGDDGKMLVPLKFTATGKMIISEHYHPGGPPKLGATNFAGKWYVTQDDRKAKTDFWNDQHPKKHYPPPRKDTKRKSDFGGRDDWYGPNALFKVKDVGAYSEWGTSITIQFVDGKGNPLMDDAGNPKEVHFGHFTEISHKIMKASKTKQILGPGTYLGATRGFMGLMDGPHIHGANTNGVHRNTWIKWLRGLE